MTIRSATELDLGSLYRIAEEMGATHEHKYFEQCLAEQAAEKRMVLVCERDDQLVGYAQLIWSPLYAGFRRLNIPETQDLNVIPDYRKQGIGSKLVDACEAFACKAGRLDMGISVGLHPRYGAAQRLYIKKGYVPDGAGACYDDIPVRAGDLRPIDDLLTLKLVKNQISL